MIKQILYHEHVLAACLSGGSSEGGDELYDLSQGAPHGVQRGPLISRIRGGMNTKLHAIADMEGCPIRFLMTAGQASDYTVQRLFGTIFLLSSRNDVSMREN